MIGVLHVLFDVHTTVAPVAVPASLMSASGVVRDAPAALFHRVFGTTPAVSVAAIAVPLPTKSIDSTPPTLAVTVNPPEALWFSAPLVPVTVNVDVPAGVFAAVVTVIVAVPDVAIVVGEKDAVVFAGRPATPSVTVPVNPLRAATVTV